jgi:hypothetical protein
VIHVLGLEVSEEYNGEVRFQISSFLKKLQAFKSLAILDTDRTFKMGRGECDTCFRTGSC